MTGLTCHDDLTIIETMPGGLMIMPLATAYSPRFDCMNMAVYIIGQSCDGVEEERGWVFLWLMETCSDGG